MTYPKTVPLKFLTSCSRGENLSCSSVTNFFLMSSVTRPRSKTLSTTYNEVFRYISWKISNVAELAFTSPLCCMQLLIRAHQNAISGYFGTESGIRTKRITIFIFLLYFYNCIVPLGFLPSEIWVAFPGESQLQKSRATQPTVQAGCFSVSTELWHGLQDLQCAHSC